MIRALVSGAVRLRGLVVGLAVAILALGLVTLDDKPADVLPEFTPAYVEIQTESLGLSANEVEQLLTVPLEADLLNGVQGVDVLRSTSSPGLSSIVLVFEPGFDLYRGRQLVQERLTQLGGAAFPNVSKPATMLPPLSSSSRVMMIGLSSKSLSPIQQSVIARWTIRPRLMGVPGVANVSVWGMRDRQIQVQVDPEKLRDQNVTLSDVIRTAGNAQVASPVSYLEASVPGTGGFIETPSQRLPVRNVFDNIASPKALGTVPLEGGGGQLQLSDVATVKQAHQPLIGNAVVGGEDGLILVIEKFPGADTAEVSANVQAELDRLKAGLGDLETDTSIFRPADYIAAATHNIVVTGAVAALLLLVVLVGALRRWRTVVIAAISVPVALVAAILVVAWLDGPINAVTLAGIAIASGLVVDTAVTGSLALSRSSGPIAATQVVGRPLVYGSLIMALAAVPIVVLEGRPGAFLEPLAAAYVAAVAAAALLALTLTPALGTLLASSDDGPGEPAATRSRASSPMGAPAIAIALVGALVVLVVTPLLDRSVVPDLKDPAVLVRLESPAGTSNLETTKIATELSARVRAIDGVSNVGASVGRAVTGDRIVDVNSAEIVANISGDADYDDTVGEIRKVARSTSGAKATVTTFLNDRVRNIGALMSGHNVVGDNGLDVFVGADRPLVVRLYGQDPSVLAKEAERLKTVVAGVEGTTDVTVQKLHDQPSLEIEVDLDKARAQGVKPGDARRVEATLLQGILVGSVFEKQKVFDVIVQGDPKLASSVDAVRGLLIDTPGGTPVRLDEIADIREGTAPTVIERESVSRKVDIVVGVSGRSVDEVGDDLEAALAKVKLPMEYHATVIDQTVAEEINQAQSVVLGFTSAIAVLLLLQAAVRRWKLAILAFLSLPAAGLGAVLVAVLLGDGLTIASGGGLVAVLGLAVRQLLASLQHFAGRSDLAEAAAERRRPITAGTLGTVALALPFAVAGSRSGLEILHPMALVVLGGAVTSLLYGLAVVPALAALAPAPDQGDDDDILLPATNGWAE